MARPKKTYRCYSCGVNFTFEKGGNDASGNFVKSDDGAVRKVEEDTQQIHYCKGAKADNNSQAYVITEESESDHKSTQQLEQSQHPQQSEQSTEANHKAGDTKSLGDTMKSEIENKTPSSGSEQNPAKEPLWKLVEPFAENQVKQHTAPIIEGMGLVADLLETSVEDLSRRIESIVSLHQSPTSKIIEHTVTLVSETEIKKIEGCHRQQAELVEYLAMRGFDGNRLNVMLVGPAGTGKTTAAAKAADILGLNFYPLSVGPQTTKTDFFGFTDAHGRPIWTVVRKAWTDGGVLLIDEIDASGAGALTYINSILANDFATFPSDVDSIDKVTVVKRHRDFCVVAAANTYGSGANRLYVGRNQLDAATLDRFVGIDWDYDTDFEQKLGASVDNLAWVEYVWKLREAQNALAIRAVFGTRKILFGLTLLAGGKSLKATKNATVWFGVSPDDKAKIKSRIGETN